MNAESRPSRSPKIRRWLITTGILGILLIFPIYLAGTVWYSETKGPFKNWMQVVDLEGDGDLDVLVSHTRWEQVGISWAGVGRWVNQGGGTFELVQKQGMNLFNGFAAVAGDVDQDGDQDIFNQDFEIRLLVNQGGLQGGEAGKYLSSGGINLPPAYNEGYRDMGGTITMGDLNGDGMLDAFIAGCCYGVNNGEPEYGGIYAPAVSWVWINDSSGNTPHTGHIIPMESLDAQPIRQVALGDLDGDGDLDVFAAVGKPTLGTTDSLDDLILLNEGMGGVQAFDQPLGNTDSTSVVLGDVNGDGRLDALVGTSGGASLWINQSQALTSGGPIFILAEQSFEFKQTFGNRIKAGVSRAAEKLGLYLPYGSSRTKAVFMRDLDGDGDLDALLARIFGAEIWWNDGRGAFHRSDVKLEYREDTGVAVADFDADGDQDIFFGRNEEDDYKVWWNDGLGAFTSDDG